MKCSLSKGGHLHGSSYLEPVIEPLGCFKSAINVNDLIPPMVKQLTYNNLLRSSMLPFGDLAS